jgi:glycosyltransferase involved in cell wall biosynthesis
MRILFLEPFYGGSHRDFADGLVEHTGHEVDLVTLPARFWKWRMRGASLYFAHAVENPTRYDLVLATDLMSIADLRALSPERLPPVLLYMHENQLSYPVPESERRDLHFGFTDITSALSSDCVVFNSVFHKSSFFEELPQFLRRMPEYRPTWAVAEIERRSRVLYPGCRFDPDPPADLGRARRSPRPRILWNHRWEFDKRPEVFFGALYELLRRGRDFDVVILGENFQAQPSCFLEARTRLGERVLQFGFVESRREYFEWLGCCDIVVSTATQENFGISVMEAMWSGCIPVLPNRLSYPELIPPKLHREVLYADDHELVVRLDQLLQTASTTDRAAGGAPARGDATAGSTAAGAGKGPGCAPARDPAAAAADATAADATASVGRDGPTRGPAAGARLSRLRTSVAAVAARHAWKRRIADYDELFEFVAAGRGCG